MLELSGKLAENNHMKVFVIIIILFGLLASPLAADFCDQSLHDIAGVGHGEADHDKSKHGKRHLAHDDCCSFQVQWDGAQRGYAEVVASHTRSERLPPFEIGLSASIRPDPLLEPPSRS